MQDLFDFRFFLSPVIALLSLPAVAAWGGVCGDYDVTTRFRLAEESQGRTPNYESRIEFEVHPCASFPLMR